MAELPTDLDAFMTVNPRVPNRTKKGVLSGPVVKGIIQTLTESPEDMALKNQGIYLLVENAHFEKGKGGSGRLTLELTNQERHGIVNGGHTYAAIRSAIDNADDDQLEMIKDAFVRLHVLQGINEARVAEIAEGLNRSKQVDDPSLDNLRHVFDRIKEAMSGKPGESAIAYHLGDDGELYIIDVLVYLQLFNCERYTDSRHPFALYRKPKTASEHFRSDLRKEETGQRSPTRILIPAVHELLALAGEMKSRTPEAAKRVGFEYGRMKTGPRKRAGSDAEPKILLPFTNRQMRHNVTRGWLMPMLAAFRANVLWDLASDRLMWRIPLEELLDGVLDDLVRVCVTEHRDNNNKPEWVGSREPAYRQCYDKVLLYLARRGKLVENAA